MKQMIYFWRTNTFTISTDVDYNDNEILALQQKIHIYGDNISTFKVSEWRCIFGLV